MNHFFVEPNQIQGKRVVITGENVNHIKNVLRMRPGEEISVSNGTDGKEYRCGIAEIKDREVVCGLRFIKEEGLELASKIYLFQGLPKADKMELIIQKAVELGVYEIVPVACKRSVVKLDGKKAAGKVQRWQVTGFGEAINYAGQLPVKLIPYELAGVEGETMEKTRAIMKNLKPGEDIAVFIGPEGGFEEKEVAGAMAAGALPITLGRRILRTETAGITVLSILMYHLEQ